jgi:ferrous iron transport protein B
MSSVAIDGLACHVVEAPLEDAMTRQRGGAAGIPVVALVGRPNVGKSTFLARASGRFAEAVNAPGTTVGVSRREIRVDGRPAILVDFPGALTLHDVSAGLGTFWRLLVAERPDAILAIADAGDIGRHLPLILALRDLDVPIVVAANLADEAATHGVELDAGRLSQLLAAPVVPMVARDGRGVSDALRASLRVARRRRRASPALPYGGTAMAALRALRSRIEAAASGSGAAPPADVVGSATADVPAGVLAALGEGLLTSRAAATLAAAATLDPARHAVAERWAAQVERHRDVPTPLADRLATAVTRPLPGLPLFVVVTGATLIATMVAGTLLSTALSGAWSAVVSPPLTAVVRAFVPAPPLAAATLWALDGGLLAMLSVGIPFVLSFYVLLALLEDSGYLAGAAVLTDRLFNVLGLPGRAAIPLLAATGCNVPAIYGTRVLDTRRERLLATFLITLAPCSARSAVVIAAVAPFAGPPAALAAFAVVALIAAGAGIGANLVVPGYQAPMVLELPRLRRPIARAVAAKAWHRFRAFVRTATPVMLVGSFVLGGLYEVGATGPLEQLLAPVTTGLLGLPPVAGIALVLAFLRKELALQLLLVLAIAEYGASAASLGAFMSSGQLFVYAVVTAVSIPCAATLATMVGEFGWRPALSISAATLAVALGAGAVLARLLGVA